VRPAACSARTIPRATKQASGSAQSLPGVSRVRVTRRASARPGQGACRRALVRQRERSATVIPSAGRVTLLVAALASTAVAQQDTAKSPIRKRTVYEDLQMFSQVLNQIRVNHPDSIDTHELLMAAIEGMVHAADPHSFVIPNVRLSPAREQAMKDGKLFPVPIEFDYLSGGPVVTSVASGTAASHQDILPGDELVAVDGKPVTAESAMELDVMLSGAKGSTTTLSLERRRSDGTLASLDRAVKRE